MVESQQQKFFEPSEEETRTAKVGSLSEASTICELHGLTQRLGVTRPEEIMTFRLHLATRLLRTTIYNESSFLSGPLAFMFAKSRLRRFVVTSSDKVDRISRAAEKEMQEEIEDYVHSHRVDTMRARTLELAANELVAKGTKNDPRIPDFVEVFIDKGIVATWIPPWRERLRQARSGE